MKTVDLEYKNFTLLVLNRRKNTDKKLISKYSENIFNLLKGAYEHLDDWEIYLNKEDLKSKATIYKIVINKEEGKIAFQWIIKSDIKNLKKYYWIEAFGHVADWEEEYSNLHLIFQ